MPLFNKFEDLNFEHLRRRRQYQKDPAMMTMEPEYQDEKQKRLKTFYDLPDISPIVNNIEDKKSTKAMQGIDWDNVTPEQKQTVLDNTSSIKTRQVTFDKPIAVIFNPNSGKKVNLLPMVEARFKAEGIQYKLLGTTKQFDTYMYAKNLDLSSYSAIVVIGGDGSVHEVFNGLFAQTH